MPKNFLSSFVRAQAGRLSSSAGLPVFLGHVPGLRRVAEGAFRNAAVPDRQAQVDIGASSAEAYYIRELETEARELTGTNPPSRSPASAP
jgi:hypothetical protein